MNIAVVDTGLDYTHADFGGAGTTEAYQTALNSTADPLTDPKVSKLLDKTKFKGGYDHAGATYNPNAGNNNPTPDANPIDGQGGHHGTHVAGTALGYGVKADGTSGKTDTAGYQKLTAGDIASWKIGPAPLPRPASTRTRCSATTAAPPTWCSKRLTASPSTTPRRKSTATSPAASASSPCRSAAASAPPTTRRTWPWITSPQTTCCP